jgi:hypothetical protein
VETMRHTRVNGAAIGALLTVAAFNPGCAADVGQEPIDVAVTDQALTNNTTALDHIALNVNGLPTTQLFETRRRPDSTWDSYAPLTNPPAVSGSNGRVLSVEEQAIGNETHIVVTAGDGVGTVWHRIRMGSAAPGPWGNASQQMTTSTAITSMGLADVAGELHLCAIGMDGHLYHGIRHSTASGGRWEHLNDVDVAITRPPGVTFTQADCAGDKDGNLHVVAITPTGAMYRTERFGSTQGWLPYASISPAGLSGNNFVFSVAVAIELFNGVDLDIYVLTHPFTGGGPADLAASGILNRNKLTPSGLIGWKRPEGSGNFLDVSAATLAPRDPLSFGTQVVLTDQACHPVHAIHWVTDHWTPFSPIAPAATGLPANTSFCYVTATGTL